MKFKVSKLIKPLSGAVVFSAALATLIVLATTRISTTTSAYLAVAASPLLALGAVLLDEKFGLHLPPAVTALVCAHIIMAIDLGTALGFYDMLWWWDLLAHGLFGFLCSVVVLCLYMKFDARRPRTFELCIILFVTLGVAALWELYEFAAGGILGEDMQKVQESVNAGLSPLFDTMTDIAIAMVGTLIFYVTYFIDRKTGGKLYSAPVATDKT